MLPGSAQFLGRDLPPARNGVVNGGCGCNEEEASGPLEAMKGPTEKIIYILCLQSPENETKKSGYLATVDVNPYSSEYSKVIHRWYTPDQADELHHFGWNSCVSCKNPAIKRKYLIIPGFRSGNIYIVDAGTNPSAPKLFKTILGSVVRNRFDITYPHTVHCIPSGEVMISYLGDSNGDAKGTFLLLDGRTFEPTGLWNNDNANIMGYDFWYQPRHNVLPFIEPISSIRLYSPKSWSKIVSGHKFLRQSIPLEAIIKPRSAKWVLSLGGMKPLILPTNQPEFGEMDKPVLPPFSLPGVLTLTHEVSTEFGAPNAFMTGFHIGDFQKGLYGTKLHYFDWTKRELISTQDLGPDGAIPLEIRFLHNPASSEGFVGAALGSSIFNIHKTAEGKWNAIKVLQIPPKVVSGWTFPEMPSLITDILISLDDRFLYFANFVHGDVRQYDITDTRKPKFVSQVFLGGSICKDGPIKVLSDPELSEQPDRAVIKGVPMPGAPNMLQLSRDGKRLYVTMSLVTPWDHQFYPEMTKKGSGLIILDCSEKGMKINHDFYVDFGSEPDGAVRGHEVRYPGGDCSSDIWV